MHLLGPGQLRPTDVSPLLLSREVGCAPILIGQGQQDSESILGPCGHMHHLHHQEGCCPTEITSSVSMEGHSEGQGL